MRWFSPVVRLARLVPIFWLSTLVGAAVAIISSRCRLADMGAWLLRHSNYISIIHVAFAYAVVSNCVVGDPSTDVMAFLCLRRTEGSVPRAPVFFGYLFVFAARYSDAECDAVGSFRPETMYTGSRFLKIYPRNPPQRTARILASIANV